MEYVFRGQGQDVLLRREAAKLERVPAWRIQVSGMDAAARIVAAGLGPAVLPLEAIEGHACMAQLAIVPLTDPWAVRRFRIRTRSDGSTAAGTRLLVQHLHSQPAMAG